MTDNSTDIRKYLNVIKEGGPLAPGVFDDPMAAPAVDPTANDPMDDAASTGPETKIEVTMKDGEEVEVEVYAQQGDELKRLMDLAGMFHKDKQSGTLGGDMGADMAPDMGAGTDIIPIEPMDGGVSDIPPDGGTDVPVGADMAPDMGMECSRPYIDFLYIRHVRHQK